MLGMLERFTGNLDSAAGENILRLLRELTDETHTALVLVTHSEEAAAICHERIHFLRCRRQPGQIHMQPTYERRSRRLRRKRQPNGLQPGHNKSI